MNAVQQKETLRAVLKTRRSQVCQERRNRAAEQLCEALVPHRGKLIAAYAPIGSEADPMTALHEASSYGRVALPVVTAPECPLTFYIWTPDMPMHRGAFGIMEPQLTEACVPDVVIVPLLGFDNFGARLGYGGGFYDRTLAQIRQIKPVLCIGFGFDIQQTDVPTEPTDQPLDAVVTENGLRRCDVAQDIGQ